MPRALLVLTCAVVLTATGCGVGPGKAGPTATARAFYAALDSGDGAAGCEKLTPEARHKLVASQGADCAKALTSLQLSGGTLRRVEVYGDGARVVLDSDTAFLAKFSDGWRISAAGCKERGKELPYDCQLES